MISNAITLVLCNWYIAGYGVTEYPICADGMCHFSISFRAPRSDHQPPTLPKGTSCFLHFDHASKDSNEAESLYDSHLGCLILEVIPNGISRVLCNWDTARSSG